MLLRKKRLGGCIIDNRYSVAPTPGWWQRLRHWREERQLRRFRVSPGDWQAALGDWAVYQTSSGVPP